MKSLGSDYDLAREEAFTLACTANRPYFLSKQEDGNWYCRADVVFGAIVIYPALHPRSRGTGVPVKWAMDKFGAKTRVEYLGK